MTTVSPISSASANVHLPFGLEAQSRGRAAAPDEEVGGGQRHAAVPIHITVRRDSVRLPRELGAGGVGPGRADPERYGGGRAGLVGDPDVREQDRRLVVRRGGGVDAAGGGAGI